MALFLLSNKNNYLYSLWDTTLLLHFNGLRKMTALIYSFVKN